MSDSKLIFNANKYPLEAGTRILEASAGTGKTFSLAHLVLRHITEAKCPIDQMLIISFTKATAAEIKSRINERLILALKALEPNTPNSRRPLSDATLIEWIDKKTTDKNNKNCWSSLLLKALEDIDNADITTIHGFCSRTIKREAISLSSHTNPEALSDEENRDLHQLDQSMYLAPIVEEDQENFEQTKLCREAKKSLKKTPNIHHFL